MAFGNIISSPRGNLSLQQALDLTNLYLENASKSTDPDIRLVLCHDTEISLVHVKRAAKKNDDKAMHERIGAAYIDLGDLLDTNGLQEEAQAFYKKSLKWGSQLHGSGRPTLPSRPINYVPIKTAPHAAPNATANATTNATTNGPLPQPSLQNTHKQGSDTTCTTTVASNIFPTNVRPPAIDFKPPEPDSRLSDTNQLVCCLGLLQSTIEPDDVLDPAVREWLKVTKDEADEKERLDSLATDVIRAFKRDEFKNAKSVTEIVQLSPVLHSDDFRYLLKEFYTGIEQSGLLDVHQLEGLARLVQGGGFIDSDDLVKVLDLLSTLLRGTHQQSIHHMYKLTMALSHVLDAMADAKVEGLNRETLHEPLKVYLDEMRKGTDPYLVYQAAYAYQALLRVPDDETPWQAAMRRTGKFINGVSGIVSAVKGLDLNKFFASVVSIQQGAKDALDIAKAITDTYKEAMALGESGKDFIDCLKEGFSFSQPRAWYSALRGADTLLREGQVADFRKLVCEVPCRRDPAFLWGVCQRLGEIAANRTWEPETRKSAILFLGEIYRDDAAWGRQPSLKRWILNILMQLSSLPGSDMQCK
ncbi:hypothetical protein BGX34_002968 [Mortierella sp. NVP85]|nr:hypothetical protein BGX34_002968 [Mortierella sp. NVP85]